LLAAPERNAETKIVWLGTPARKSDHTRPPQVPLLRVVADRGALAG
jgi:hypothetical protein